MKCDRKKHGESESAGASGSDRCEVTKTGRFRRWRKLLILTVVLLAIIYLLGPRITNSEIERRSASGVPDELSELDGYLTRSEARFPDIVAGTEKLIR